MNAIAQAVATAAEPPRRFGTLLWPEIGLQPDGDDYLVKRLLGSAAMSVVYGESGCGKSFWSLDLAMHVALGWDWRGRKVTQSGVLYVAAEGGHGQRRRVAAFRQRNKLDIDDDVPFALVPASVDLLDPEADTEALIAEARAINSAMSRPVALVVVDTLSRALAGGDENGSADMGAFVRNVDRIRRELNAHVLIVHHSGKDRARGARGHNSLRAACDCEIEIAKDEDAGIATATVRKQREGSDGDAFTFRLDRVVLAEDADGDEVTSCVVVEAKGESRAATPRPKVSGAAKVALDILRRAVDEAGETPPASNHIPTGLRAVNAELWRKWCYAGTVSDSDDAGAKRKAFNRASATLQAAGAIGTWQDWVWPA